MPTARHGRRRRTTKSRLRRERTPATTSRCWIWPPTPCARSPRAWVPTKVPPIRRVAAIWPLRPTGAARSRSISSDGTGAASARSPPKAGTTRQRGHAERRDALETARRRFDAVYVIRPSPNPSDLIDDGEFRLRPDTERRPFLWPLLAD